jgi:hypothetical protein
VGVLMTLIGNSGFEFVVGQKGDHKKTGWRAVSAYGTRYDIRNIKTKNIIFSLWYGKYISYKKQEKKTTVSDEKKFLGLDKRYYWIKAYKSTCSWGQIQSDGAVLKSDRSIIKVLAFFPHYTESETEITAEAPIIVKEPPNIPKVVIISPTPIKTPTKENVSWIQKIINWIIAILNR